MLAATPLSDGVAVGDSHGVLHLMQSGKEVAAVQAHVGSISAVAKGGRFVFTAGLDMSVRVLLVVIQ